ncbi:MAG: hypothetical protein H0X34_11630 [Chthoniobacterales bacterium]|nr:hypothetical protein [Chthoniobacterales bacterium]
MKKFFFLSIAGAMAALLPHPVCVADEAAQGKHLAQEVWQASGGPNWSNVKTIDFTFAVEKNGKIVAQAEHHWDVATQTDEVKWKGKDVTVNLADPASTEEAKAAYARWVNDSYWLLAPVKLKDRGVRAISEGTKESDGAKRDVLRLSFAKVGLTPNDEYRLYVDPATKLVTAWDYLPKGEKGMSGTWENYEKTGGLTLATDHKMDGGVRIRILNLKVTSAK